MELGAQLSAATALATKASGGWVMGNSGTVPAETRLLPQLASRPGVSTVCEVGFNAGHGAITLLHGLRTRLVEFDLLDLPYSAASKAYVRSLYPGRTAFHRGCTGETLLAHSQRQIPEAFRVDDRRNSSRKSGGARDADVADAGLGGDVLVRVAVPNPDGRRRRRGIAGEPRRGPERRGARRATVAVARLPLAEPQGSRHGRRHEFGGLFASLPPRHGFAPLPLRRVRVEPLLDGAPRMAAIRTRTPCKMLVLSKPQFAKFLQLVSDFKHRLRRTKEPRKKQSELNVASKTENYSIAAHRELDEEAQERVDEVQSKLRELQEDASLAQEGAAARRGGRKKVEDVDAAAVAIQRTLRGKRGRARARASKG